MRCCSFVSLLAAFSSSSLFSFFLFHGRKRARQMNETTRAGKMCEKNVKIFLSRASRVAWFSCSLFMQRGENEPERNFLFAIHFCVSGSEARQVDCDACLKWAKRKLNERSEEAHSEHKKLKIISKLKADDEGDLIWWKHFRRTRLAE